MKDNDESALHLKVDSTMANLINAQHPILNANIYCCYSNKMKVHIIYNLGQYCHVVRFASHYLAVLKNERR